MFELFEGLIELVGDLIGDAGDVVDSAPDVIPDEGFGLPDVMGDVGLADLAAELGSIALTSAAVMAGAVIAFAVFNYDEACKFFRELFPKTDRGKEILESINNDPDTQAWLKGKIQGAPTISMKDLGVMVDGIRKTDDDQYVTDMAVFHKGSMVGRMYTVASRQKPTNLHEGMVLEL